MDYDVLVCGGGCAGVAAALAAARNGAHTLLVERAGFAGGIMTTVGLPFFDGIADIRDNRIIARGIGLELFVKMGGCAPDATFVAKHNPTFDNVERFKLLLDRLLTAEGDRLHVLFHTIAAGVETEGDHITGVVLANKGGLSRVGARVTIDCTGDADIAAWAGEPTEKLTELQPLTLHFRIGHVRRSPDVATQCREALVRAYQRGELPMFYGPGINFMFAADEVYVHAVRVPADATDPTDLTRAEMQARRDAWTMYECWKREVPGFQDAYFIMSGPYIGVHETRRIIGQYVLSENDILAHQSFEDAIATGCWYLDQHPNRVTLGAAQDTPKVQPVPYDIPYRTLLPQRSANLLVAGRCHSATQLAASSTRVTVTVMSLGQAAGAAAALAVRANLSPQNVDGRALRATLTAQDAGPYRGVLMDAAALDPEARRRVSEHEL